MEQGYSLVTSNNNNTKSNLIYIFIKYNLFNRILFFAYMYICFISDGKSYCKNLTVDKQPEADYVEKVVCDENDVGENEMKQFEIDEDSKVLLVKQNGVLSAIGTKCSHYGALLSTGALSEGRIRCPWHGACFNIRTGMLKSLIFKR